MGGANGSTSHEVRRNLEMRPQKQEREIRNKMATNAGLKIFALNLTHMLREYRRLNSLGQKQIAASLGITREHYAMIETGNRTPSVRLIAKISDLIKTTQESLLVGPAGLEHGREATCIFCRSLSDDERAIIDQLIKHFQRSKHA